MEIVEILTEYGVDIAIGAGMILAVIFGKPKTANKLKEIREKRIKKQEERFNKLIEKAKKLNEKIEKMKKE